MCNQAVGLVQRAVEAKGIVTAGVSIARELSEQIKPPRTLFLKYPFGHPLGLPNQVSQQRAILMDLLELMRSVEKPGTIVDSPYRWKRTKFE